MKKTALIIFTILAMLMSTVFSFNAYGAVSDAVTSEAGKTYGPLSYVIADDDEVKITDCSTSSTSVKIPAVIENCPVTIIGERAFHSCDITAIEIPDSIKTIEKEAFSYCTDLVSVVIPEGVEEIPDGAFSNCTSLESITLPSTVRKIGHHAVTGAKLKTLVIPAKVSSIENSAISGCTKLQSVTVPCYLDTYTIFYDCKQITEINKTHTWGELAEKKPATDTEDGLKEADCEFCLEKLQEVIPAKNGSSSSAITAEPVDPDTTTNDLQSSSSETKKSSSSKKDNSDDDYAKDEQGLDNSVIITIIIVSGITLIACVTIVTYFVTKKK